MFWGCTIPARFPLEGSWAIRRRHRRQRFAPSGDCPRAQGLYDPRNEKDSCGVGFVCDLGGTPSHSIVERGIEVLNHLLHRGAAGADAGTGDGAGILVQIPHRFFEEACRSLGFSLPQAGRYGTAMLFMPLGARDPDGLPGGRGQGPRGRRSARARLARSAYRADGSGRGGPGDPSGGLAVLHRFGRAQRRGARAQALRRPQAVRESGDRGAGRRRSLLRTQLLVPHHRLQGPHDGHRDPGLLPGPQRAAVRERLGRRPPALQHQHVPLLGTRPAVPLPGAQRRDQYPARQPQLDPLAPVGARVRPVRSRLQEAVADHRRARQRFRLPRQRARVAHHRRPRHPARHAHARPSGVGGQVPHGTRPTRLLRISRRFDGALGRPRRGGLQRRPCGRGPARPQRPATRALHHHQGRIHGARLRGGGARLPPRAGAGEGRPQARADDPGRPGGPPGVEGRGDQDQARAAPALPALGGGEQDLHPWLLRRGRAAHARDRQPAPPPEVLRLHPRGRQAHTRPHGGHRQRAGRLHGGRRAAGGPLRAAAAPLLVLQATLCAGHQPGHRLRSARSWSCRS